MKTLANCDPYEFLVQTNRIRKSAQKWLTLTKILDIRKTLPRLRPDMSEDERQDALIGQIQENISRMLTAVLEEYPAETAELFCLICFIEPADMKKHTMAELLPAITEILENPEVLGFFTSLAQLALRDGSAPVKA